MSLQDTLSKKFNTYQSADLQVQTGAKSVHGLLLRPFGFGCFRKFYESFHYAIHYIVTGLHPCPFPMWDAKFRNVPFNAISIRSTVPSEAQWINGQLNGY